MTVLDVSITLMPESRPAQHASLDDRTAFLLSQLGHHCAARFAERLRPLGLQPRHFGLLSHIAAADGPTQQQLADALAVHRNVMVGIVDDLEDRGLVQREPHSSDRRAHAIHLTAAGRDLLPRAQQAADALETELTAGLRGADRRQLVSLLQRVATDANLQPGSHPSLNRTAR